MLKVLTNATSMAAAMSLGIVPRKSHIACAPVRFIDNFHFWRGVIDGDGYMGVYGVNHTEPRIGLTGSRRMVTQFAEFVERHVPGTQAKPRATGSIFQYEINCRLAACLIERLYKNEPCALVRKSILAHQILQEHGRG